MIILDNEADLINEFEGLSTKQLMNQIEYDKGLIKWDQYKYNEQIYAFKQHEIYCKMTGIPLPEYEYE